MKRICSTCRYFEVDELYEPAGNCRRYAPVSDDSINDSDGRWPQVEDNEWCGMWEVINEKKMS